MASRSQRPLTRPPIVRQTATTRIPDDLDDEPLDLEIDTADIPLGPSVGASRGAASRSSPASSFDWLRLILFTSMVLYIVVGIVIGAALAFNGAALAGWAAFSRPGFYLVVLFWPVSVWFLLTTAL